MRRLLRHREFWLYSQSIVSKLTCARWHKTCTAFPRGGIRGLSYGVMVAQQVLVLFVLVRIQVGQLSETCKKERLIQSLLLFFVLGLCLLELSSML